MHRPLWRFSFVAAVAGLAAGCNADATDETAPAGSNLVAPVPVVVAAAVERPVTRYIRVTGTLRAQEEAEVAAEVAGRIVATPVERGTRVGHGAVLVRIAATEVEAQVREAEANAAQLEAKIGRASCRERVSIDV